MLDPIFPRQVQQKLLNRNMSRTVNPKQQLQPQAMIVNVLDFIV